jgi:TonB-dependent starch-binding outer membrane protein SusC
MSQNIACYMRSDQHFHGFFMPPSDGPYRLYRIDTLANVVSAVEPSAEDISSNDIATDERAVSTDELPVSPGKRSANKHSSSGGKRSFFSIPFCLPLIKHNKHLFMTKLRLLHKMLLCIFFLFALKFVQAQDRTITGTVVDDKGAPLQNATVKVKGASQGVSTDQSGNFSISVPVNVTTLVISYVGFKAQEVRIIEGKALKVSLAAGVSSLDEVVVVGYGTQRRKDVTGAVVSIKGNAIKDLPMTSVTQALQGRAAGVEVIDNSGQPGTTPTIIIRGLSSLHQPLPLYIVDGVRVPADNINLQDIASIDILKDASAAAIYGSAAAGGVILITTKKGTGGAPAVSFSTRYGVTVPKLVHLLDKTGFINLENIIAPQIFKGATQTDTLANTDWVKQLYGHGIEQNYNLSVLGSSATANYLFSGFYNAQKGIFLRNYSNIAGARINSDYKLNSWLKVGEQLSLSQRKTVPLVGAQAQQQNAPFRTQPVIPLHNKDGSWGTVPPGYPGLTFGGPNPVGAVESADALDYQNNIQGNVYGEIKLPLHLSFRTTFGYTYFLENQDYFQNTFNFGAVSQANNSLTKMYNESKQVLDNFVLTYDQHFGQHSLNAVAGYEQITTTVNGLNSIVTSVGLPDYSIVPTSNSTFISAGNYDPNGLIKSYFGRLNYNYAGRYYLSGSIRQDANYTVFGPNKQKATFGAASVGWNISDEEFFKPLASTINVLKLRGSYGTLGNSAIPPYSYASTYSEFGLNTGYPALAGANFAPGAPMLIGNAINAIPNPNLHWETIYETNIGLDAEALNSKLYFTVEWYNRTTKNMLYALPLPFSSGFTSPYFTNIGEVSSKGVDILLGYRDHVGKLGYDVSVNGGFNSNKVTNLDGIKTGSLPDGYNYYINGKGNEGYGAMPGLPITITKAGLPFGSFFGYKSLGLFQTDAQAAASAQPNAHAGDLHFYHDPKNGSTLTGADYQVIGNPNPKFVFGVNMRFNYGGFDLAMLFTGVLGVQLFNGVKSYEEAPFSGDGSTTSKVFGDSYVGNNGLTSQPRLGISNPNGTFTQDPNHNYSSVSSYFVENGNYIKLKNLQLGYSFSNSLITRAKIKSARLFVMANNLFVITKYSGLDPEIGSSSSLAQANGFVGGGIGVTTRGLDAVSQYPHTRIFSAGLDINF